jgi:hypothetical protein
MLKNFKYFFIFLFIVSCIEPYEFVIPADSQALVVEAFISDKSFTDTKSYPSDGRYFSVTLSYTSDVTNVRPIMISGASVSLINDLGEQWDYTESADQVGVYYLLDDDFKALKGIKYKLKVFPPNDSGYESEWEKIPVVETPLMGGIGFAETELRRYEIEANQPVLNTVKGVTTNIILPENNTQVKIFYRWEFTPLWIYIAPLVSVSNPGYRCWATSRNYISDYVLQSDNAGGYKKDLFFLETIRNERLFEDLSVLVLQYAVNEDYYSFWNEMKQQVQGGALFDLPPYNLHSNLNAIDGEKAVSGYFGVVQEQAKRWYFNVKDLSYYVENTLKADCLVVYGPGPPAEECLDCRFYSFGTTTTTKPLWWRE